jgi:hypothetical protein
MENPMPTWRDVPGAPTHEINSDGVIRTKKTGRLLPGTLHSQEYLQTCLRSVGTVMHHKLVAELFVPNPDNLPHVRMKDGNRANPRADNIEWSASPQYLRSTKRQLKPRKK